MAPESRIHALLVAVSALFREFKAEIAIYLLSDIFTNVLQPCLVQGNNNSLQSIVKRLPERQLRSETTNEVSNTITKNAVANVHKKIIAQLVRNSNRLEANQKREEKEHGFQITQKMKVLKPGK